jgi:hypothetical protein
MADLPPYDAVIVAFTGVLTTCVSTLKFALVLPATTMTLAGTTAVPSLASVTFAPPAGAGAVNVAVAVTFVPPTTVAGDTVRDASCDVGDTDSDGD